MISLQRQKRNDDKRNARTNLNQLLIKERQRGMSYSAIAHKHNLSESTVRNILKKKD